MFSACDSQNKVHLSLTFIGQVYVCCIILPGAVGQRQRRVWEEGRFEVEKALPLLPKSSRRGQTAPSESAVELA